MLETALNSFQAANSIERTEFLANLARLCSKYELRFLGSLIEDFAICFHAEISDEESCANSEEHLRSLANIGDPILAAHRMACYVPLLKRFNYQASSLIVEILLVRCV